MEPRTVAWLACRHSNIYGSQVQTDSHQAMRARNVKPRVWAGGIRIMLFVVVACCVVDADVDVVAEDENK